MSFSQGFRGAIRRARDWLDPGLEQDDLFHRVYCCLWGLVLVGFGLLGWSVLAMGPDAARPASDWLPFAALLMGTICPWWGGRLLLRCVQSAQSPGAQFTDKYLTWYGAWQPGEVYPLCVAKLLTQLLRLFGVRGQSPWLHGR